MKQWVSVLIQAALVYGIALLVLSQGANIPLNTSAWASAIIAVIVGVVLFVVQVRL